MANNSCDNLSTHHDENESVINQSGIDDENESATVDKSSEQEEKALSTTLLEIKGPTCWSTHSQQVYIHQWRVR